MVEVELRSILDTDLYKLSMQQAVLQHFPDALVEYRFTNRKGTKISRACFEAIEKSVGKMRNLRLTSEERQYLEATCPFLKPEYLDYLSDLSLDPDNEVLLSFDDKEELLALTVRGLWARVILYEVPLLSLISENYFTTVDVNWEHAGQKEHAKQKAKALLEAGCLFSEFGTRRRRSIATQESVILGLVEVSREINKGALLGTSNVHLAHKYNLKPIGTIAHEWIMGVGAKMGYKDANKTAMDLWTQTYKGALSIMITDTFTTDAFFNEMRHTPELLEQWNGLRQDSGDPIDILHKFHSVYKELGIDYTKKQFIFSDALDLEKCLKIQEAANAIGANASYGIGTYLTNDFFEADHKTVSDPLNIVIKISKIDDKPCLKLSDDVKKISGGDDLVKQITGEIGITLDQ